MTADGRDSLLATPYECRMTSKGAEYRGSQTHTVSYRACQRWDAQTPHGHTFRHGWMFADGSPTTAGNQCRNPGGVRERPWCMTNDPDVAWEYCNVPLCGCRATRSGIDYTGAISRTVSGRVCQRWDVQQPHSHTYWSSSGSHSPGGSTARVAENYCRNPDPWDSNGPWCYTIDPVMRWEYCSVPFCECKYTRTGVEYSGRISQTRSGIECQQWSSQQPHQHDYVKDSHFPDDSVEDAVNYCRNPDPLQRSEGPWCFTKSPEVSWDYCNIPLCETADDATVDEVVLASHRTSTDTGRTTSTTVRAAQHHHRGSPLDGVTSPADVGWSSTSVSATLTGSGSLVMFILILVLIILLVVRKRRKAPNRKSHSVAVTSKSELTNACDGEDRALNGPTATSADDTTRCLLDIDQHGASIIGLDDVAHSNGIEFFLKVISSSSPSRSLSRRSRGVVCTSGPGCSCQSYETMQGLHCGDSDAVVVSSSSSSSSSSHVAKIPRSGSASATRVSRRRDENWSQFEMTSLSVPKCSCSQTPSGRRTDDDGHWSPRTSDNSAAEAGRYLNLSDRSSLTVATIPSSRRCPSFGTPLEAPDVTGSLSTWCDVVGVGMGSAARSECCYEHVLPPASFQTHAICRDSH